MHDKRTPDASSRPAPSNTTRTTSKTKRCRTCDRPYPPGSLIGGECPDCAGLVPLPLRGDRGRFLPGITHTTPKSTGSAGGTR